MFKDSFADNNVIILDSLFIKQFPNKFLKNSIQKYNLKGPENTFKVLSKGNLVAITWDSIGSDFKGSKYLFSLDLQAQIGVSIGAVDRSSVGYVYRNTIHKNSKSLFVLDRILKPFFENWRGFGQIFFKFVAIILCR